MHTQSMAFALSIGADPSLVWNRQLLSSKMLTEQSVSPFSITGPRGLNSGWNQI
jgi:hypothetical protein